MTTLNFLTILKPFKIDYYFHFLLFNFIPNDNFLLVLDSWEYTALFSQVAESPKGPSTLRHAVLVLV